MKQRLQKAFDAARFVHALMCDENNNVKTVDVSEYEISCACQARGLSYDLVMNGVKSIIAIHKTDIEINQFDPSWGYDRFTVGVNKLYSGGICGHLLHFPSPETRSGVLMDYWRAKGYHDGKNNHQKLTLPDKYRHFQNIYNMYYEDGYKEE